MAVRIRLQRFGKKGRPFYHIVVADGRAPRDGRFIVKLGTYNPMTNPATVELDVDQSVKWLRNGAQPSDTVRSLMSHKGVMLKHHLLRGVDKGAMTVEQAEAKFAAWLEEKTQKLEGAVSKINEDVRKAATLKLDAEAKVNKKRADELAKKLLVVEAPAVVEVAEETVAETELAPAEEVVAEVAEEAVAAEPEVEVAAEVATEEETPAAE